MNDQSQDICPTPVNQGVHAATSQPNKIGPATPYDFDSKNLTAYGGLLPVGTLLEKLGFRQLVEETLKVKRQTRAMPAYQFILAMVLACYVGFSRLHHMRFLQREPMLTGLLGVLRLPPQCTFWRFLASLHGSVAGQLLEVQRCMRQRVWEASNVRLSAVVLDTDTTVHTLFGDQMGARKGYNPKNKGKKSLQPILTFLAETKEYVAGELRNGDPPTGKQIAAHLQMVFAFVPKTVKTLLARRFGFLLLGRGGSVRECEMRVHYRGPQDGATGGAGEGGRVAAVATDRRRWAVRILVSAGWLGESVPVPGAAL